jgi:hypothetical protein
MTARAKVAAGALAACAAVVAATVPGPVVGQSSSIGINGFYSVFSGDGGQGIVNATRPRGARTVRVTVSLRRVEPDATYEVAATRRRCTGAPLWRATVKTGPTDDAFASLRVPLGPDRAIGAGGAGLYLIAADGSRDLVACARARGFRGG